jgi:hypothetical protein
MRFDRQNLMRRVAPMTLAVLLAAATAGCETAGTPGPVASDQTSRLTTKQAAVQNQRGSPGSSHPVVASSLMLGVW